jgi:hypothetical protein
MKRLLGFVILGGVALACGGTTIDPLLDGGSDGYSRDGSEGGDPFACGTSTCGASEVCMHPCCGGAPPACEPLEDGGTCPDGYVLSNQCYNFGTGGTTGCEPPPCKPPPPYCAPAKDCTMTQDHDCYLLCG